MRVTILGLIFGCGNGGRLIRRMAYTRVHMVIIHNIIYMAVCLKCGEKLFNGFVISLVCYLGKKGF